jgi:hypothetical protein|tara:strand:- start:278 stop:403 length:126 start_codon:yes stop_codon:yes gene_type:complete
MQTLNQGYKGLSFLMSLNIDRLLMMGAIVAALYAGSYLALI